MEELLAAFEAYAHRVGDGAEVDPADLRKFSAVFTGYADELHHEKEERVLLPFLVRHGFDWNKEPIPRVREEHEHEQYLLDVLRQAGERLVEWTDEERRHVLAAALALCDFQRHHHETENNELFPAVLQRLAEDELWALQQELEQFDAQRPHRESRGAAVAVGSELIARYGGAAATLRPAATPERAVTLSGRGPARRSR